MKFNELPPSVNNYLKPSAVVKGGKAFVHMYETKEAKDFKKRFGKYLEQEIKKQNWDKSPTAVGHWYLDCIFIQPRTNMDNNNLYKILCDTLKEYGVVEDDKNILPRTQRVLYDAKNPRFIAVLKPVEYRGIWKDEEHYTKFFENNCIQCKKNHERCAILRKALEGRMQDEIKEENEFNICEKRKL
jgi:Holliday junction resolvase RusA-like endonuclease